MPYQKKPMLKPVETKLKTEVQLGVKISIVAMMMAVIALGIAFGVSMISQVVKQNVVPVTKVDPAKTIVQPVESLFADNRLLVKFKGNVAESVKDQVVQQEVTKTRTVEFAKDGTISHGIKANDLGKPATQAEVAAVVKERKPLFSVGSAERDKSRKQPVASYEPTWELVELNTNTDVIGIAADLKKNTNVLEAQPDYNYFLQQNANGNTNGAFDECLGQADGVPCANDGNQCTDDICSGYVCTHPIRTGAICNDNNVCTYNDSCSAEGICGGQPKYGTSCGRNMICCGNYPNIPVCKLTSQCYDCESLPNGAPCNDDNSCTINDKCRFGDCIGTALTPGTECGPGLTCCSHPIECTCPSCASQPDGTPCQDDNQVCTADICQAGLCAHVPNTAACDDKNPCTTNDQCSGGTCGGAAVEQGTSCTANKTCCGDPIQCSCGECYSKPDGTACLDDGNVCTQDSCLSGQCSHTFDTASCPNYPNDNYFNTDLQSPAVYSWGQTYPDMWGLKKINSPAAWDKLYFVKRGDCNGDGSLTDADVEQIMAYLFSGGQPCTPYLAGDVNGDAQINIADTVLLTNHIHEGQALPTPSLPEPVIAVVDTGVDLTHPDIAQNIWNNAGEMGVDAQGNNKQTNGLDDDGNGFIDDFQGWSFGDKNNSDIKDSVGHGTHVAGTIAATTNNVTGVSGVCPTCKIMVLENNRLTGSSLAASINYAVQNGAQVISNSWGGIMNDPIINDALEAAHNAGVVLVFAAGNFGFDANLTYPQKPYLITVAASDPMDNPTSFTSFGSRVDVAAPGYDILSLRATGKDMYGDGTHIVGNTYFRASGTSMSAPHVAGVVGLLLVEHPAFTTEEVRSVLRLSAKDIADTGWDRLSGYGRLDVSAALDVDMPCTVKISSPGNWTNPRQNPSPLLDISGTISCPIAQTYILEYRIDKSGESWHKIGQGNTNVSDTVIASGWDTSTLPIGRTFIRLSVTDQRGRTFTDMKELKVGPILSASYPPDPLDIQNPFSSSVITDFKPAEPGKGIIFANHAFTAGGAEVATWPKVDGYYYTSAVSKLNQHVFIQRRAKEADESLHTYLEEYASNGDLIRGFNYPENTSRLTSSVIVMDLDPGNNNGEEIIFATDLFVRILKQSGEVIQIPCRMNYPFSVGDIDGGADIEVLIFNGSTAAIYKSSGQLIRTISAPVGSSSTPIVADIIGDSRGEIISVDLSNSDFSGYGTLYAYSSDGSVLWQKQVISKSHYHILYPIYMPVAADVNADGYLEIVLLSNDYLYLLDRNGNDLPGWPKAGFGYLTAEAVVANVDNDPEIEIIAPVSVGGYLNAYNVDGSTADGFPIMGTFGVSLASPAIGDIDGDNLSEIIMSDSFWGLGLQLRRYDTSASATSVWPMHLQNAQQTGAYFLTHCEDRTSYGQCNAAKQYCEKGTLVSACGLCGVGCPTGYSCNNRKCCKKVGASLNCLQSQAL